MAKYYFQQHDENCYTLQYHKDYMKDNGLQQLLLHEAKVERGTGMFFCKEYDCVGESKALCGRQCNKYKPINGKNGRCRHYGYVYERTDKTILVKDGQPY